MCIVEEYLKKRLGCSGVKQAVMIKSAGRTALNGILGIAFLLLIGAAMVRERLADVE
jgi:hypothetical protein